MLLVTRGLECGYGDVPVVHGIDISVDRGEVVALLGPNGAGKTTTLMTLAGELPLLGGDVEFLGAATTAPLHRRAKAGLAFVTEERAIFRSMSTADNLRVAGVDIAEVLTLFPELESRLRIPAGLLSGGEQQMLALGRAVARNPKLLFADELSLGLAPLVVKRLLTALRACADENGVGVLLVEQHLASALAFADRAYIMRRGHIALEGHTRDLRGRVSEIEESYFGARLDLEASPSTAATASESSSTNLGRGSGA
jgi:branched-chain amino acid transport system ATP-binding protein